MANDMERVDRFLDALSKRYLDTFEKAHMVRVQMEVFPEVDWIDALRRAAERQEAQHPEANAMRGLLRHLAPELVGAGGA